MFTIPETICPLKDKGLDSLLKRERITAVHAHKRAYKIHTHKYMPMETAPLNAINKDVLILHLARVAYV